MGKILKIIIVIILILYLLLWTIGGVVYIIRVNRYQRTPFAPNQRGFEWVSKDNRIRFFVKQHYGIGTILLNDESISIKVFLEQGSASREIVIRDKDDPFREGDLIIVGNCRFSKDSFQFEISYSSHIEYPVGDIIVFSKTHNTMVSTASSDTQAPALPPTDSKKN